MNSAPTEFRRNAVQPVTCIKEGWALVRSQFWLFAGMIFIGLLIANFVPFGILLGPIMCGIYLALFRRERGENAAFEDLFKGFDYFGPSVIATLVHFIPIFIVMMVMYVLMVVGMLVIVPIASSSESPAGPIGVFMMFGIAVLIILLLIIVLSILFAFAYPLIVDRKLSGFDAVKLSAKAGIANFGSLFGLLFLNGLLVLGGLLLCYFGVFLTIPITFGALAVAYRQVFGSREYKSPLPPPPPVFT